MFSLYSWFIFIFGWFLRGKSFLEETLKEKKDFFLKSHDVLFGLVRKFFFRKNGEHILTRCSKLHFSCPEEHVSWKKTASEKVVFFFKLGHGLEFFESLPEIFRRISEKCNLRVHIYILITSFLFFDTNLFFPRLGTSTDAFSNYHTK